MSEHLYKDGNRDWWRLTLRMGRPQPDPHNPENIDHWWSYTVAKEKGSKYRTVWRDEIWGQYDIRPSVADVLRDFATKVTTLAIGFVESEVIRREMAQESDSPSRPPPDPP